MEHVCKNCRYLRREIKSYPELNKVIETFICEDDYRMIPEDALEDMGCQYFMAKRRTKK